MMNQKEVKTATQHKKEKRKQQQQKKSFQVITYMYKINKLLEKS